jgi:hypothetical protein
MRPLKTFIHCDHNKINTSSWYGDEIHDDKPPSHTRLMFHNLNHLNLHGTEGLDMFVHEQQSLQVDVQAFSEHCLDTTKFQVNHSAKEIVRRTSVGQSLLHWNSSTESALNTFKPGGTGILMLGPLCSRLEPEGKGSDPLGRWCYVTLRRKALPPVTIISAYQVCPRPTNLLGNTAYHQQQRLLNAQGRYNMHPRKAFIEDITSLIENFSRQGHDLIIGGDFNESLEDKYSGILHVMTTNNLVDPFLQRFPHHEEFGTHIYGQRRIDIALVTPRLMNSIRLIGYAPFDYATRSDHRPLLIDFHTCTLLGKIQDIPPTLQRGVRSTDKQSVKIFIDTMYQEVQRRKGFRLQYQLKDETATRQIVEQIDAILGISGDIAESKCKRRRPEFYSQTIVRHRVKVSVLRGHLNSLKTGTDRSEQLRRKMKRVGLDFPLPNTLRLTRLAIRTATAELQELSQNSMVPRHSEFEEKIALASMTSDTQSKKILQAIKKVEANKKTYCILKAMRATADKTQKLDRVEIPASWPPTDQPVTTLEQLEDPKTCTEWRLVTNPMEVEYYLMLRNRLHFGQAQGTPFTTAPLQEDIDWAATSVSTEQLLQGTYVSTTPIPHCNDLLRACRAKTELDKISDDMTMQEFRGKVKVWRENTTTSPSGRHLGRYKALFRDVHIKQDEDMSDDAVPFATKQEQLAALILEIINYCIRNTYVLERWKTVINVMIFKDPGNFKIHRLRVIHIYEADFNLILAVKWRQLLYHANNQDLINEGQYGGRPGCEAQSLTLLEELKYDLSYLTRRSLFNFDNDASSCYDRIIVPLASVINRKYGLHRNIVATHAKTLQEARFHLKTAVGISDLHYSHCASFPIHGTGQGSGNSPCIWLFISSTLFDIHTSKAHGARFITPDGSLQVSFSMVGFVDDSTGSYNDFRPSDQATLGTMFKRMEHDAQAWNDLLYCSGGKLELPKCSFHVLHFDFLPNGRPQPTIAKYDNMIHIIDAESQEKIPIPAKRVFETHKTLGHHKSPLPNLLHEIHPLQQKANRLALLIATSPISRSGAFLAYHSIFIPSIKYTLPQSFYTKKILDQAQASSIGYIISKCGLTENNEVYIYIVR